MARCLVTGGAGFIGSHVTDELLKLGHEVVVLDDLSGGFAENVNKDANFVEGSITDYGLIKKLFKEHKFDYVFHLAAYAAEGLSHFIKRFNYDNNLIGSINLINASVNHDVKCFIFTSSIAVYGRNQLPMSEEMIPLPEDSYGIAKYAVEQELKSCKEIFGLNYVIFRPHNVYGEKQNIGDKYRNVIGIFMNNIMLGKPLPIFGDGEQTRAFSYISDVAPIIAKSPFVKGALNKVFNVGAEKPYSINQLAEEVCKAFDAKPEKVNYPARNEVVHAYSSHENVKKVFGMEEPVPLSEGIKRMAGWAKEVGSKKSKEFDDLEIRKNLPPSWS
ncbi:MAG: NAD-dependent epimerase/dehydratase family protein [Nanoarchaeota archaeon]|nr:NAD-dependent epimerase/dehydratase family protein [Nanoarchaeota archaeon]